MSGPDETLAEIERTEEPPAPIGHNAPEREKLKSFVSRIERLNEEKDALGRDVREVYAETKAQGFNPKAIHQVIRLRKMESRERQEQEALLATYMRALGMGDLL